MKAKSVESNVGVNLNFKLLEVNGDKYHVKFPNIEIPIEMNEEFYKRLLKEKHSVQKSVSKS